jgi:16S rRNA processing protein RimM
MVSEPTIVIGKFLRPCGIKGWIGVSSFTEPPESLFNYSPLFIQRNNTTEKLSIQAYRPQGNHWVVKLTHCNDRNLAATYTNTKIVISPTQLPTLEKGEYYWKDLEGLTVMTKTGEKLGIVSHLMETGSNDVLVVKGKKTHYVPYHPNYIESVDIQHQKIIVDWDPDF